MSIAAECDHTDSIAAVPVETGRALALMWSDIRRHNRAVPRATVSVSAGRGSACSSVNWSTSPVVLLAADIIAGGPGAILAELLHQAAHGIVGSASPSSEGRYHDKAYRDAAVALGLAVPEASVRGSGYAPEGLTDATRAAYAPALARLADVPPIEARAARRSRVSARCQCDPPRTILLPPSTLAAAPIVCSVCSEPFAA